MPSRWFEISSASLYPILGQAHTLYVSQAITHGVLHSIIGSIQSNGAHQGLFLKHVAKNLLVCLYILLLLCTTSCVTDNVGSDHQNTQALQDSIALLPIATGLMNPVSITHAGDGSGRLFITLQRGKVIIIDGDQRLSRTFLDITERVSCCGERGLLSIAFHPRYKSNGTFFVNYTDRNGDTIIARYTVSSDPNAADSLSEQIVIKIPQLINIHNGGQIQFGPDGYLYIGMGDGGSIPTRDEDDSGGDPRNYSQDPSKLLGKLLRLDVDQELPYAIPRSNPYVNDVSKRGEIWARGLRNPWRFSFDRLTGNIYIADVGEKSREEINFQSASSKGGENYGWAKMEGSLCRYNCKKENFTSPVFEYDHGSGCAITGGYVYRGKKYPRLYGTYLFADYCSGAIKGLSKSAAGQWGSVILLDNKHQWGKYQISSFGEDEQGELYVTHHHTDDGAIYKIIGLGPDQ